MLHLLEKRLVLVTGKGGVGKTTVAGALAVLGARRGKRVLVCEVDGPSALAPLLEGVAGEHVPRPVGERLDLAVLLPEEGLRAYLAERIRIPGVVDLALKNPVVARFFRAAPAVPEISVLYAITRLLDERGEAGAPRWDVVIVDLPASGHAYAMLSAPHQGIRIFPAGPIRTLCEGIHKILTDGELTACAVVTLPEELPVNEALDLTARLRALGLHVEAVLANAVAPEPFDPTERELIERIRAVQERPLLDGAAAAIQRAARAAEAVRRLSSALPGAPVKVPFLLARGKQLVSAVADELAVAAGFGRAARDELSRRSP